MREFPLVIAIATAALGLAAPAAAEARAVPAGHLYHPSALEAALTARLQSIRTRIELLREEGLMASDEARDLRQQSRMLERRLIGLGARDSSDVELAIARLNDRVRLAAEEGRWDALDRDDEQRHAVEDRYEAERRSGEERLDRHIAPPFDRWDDPFDRGDEL